MKVSRRILKWSAKLTQLEVKSDLKSSNEFFAFTSWSREQMNELLQYFSPRVEILHLPQTFTLHGRYVSWHPSNTKFPNEKVATAVLKTGTVWTCPTDDILRKFRGIGPVLGIHGEELSCHVTFMVGFESCKPGATTPTWSTPWLTLTSYAMRNLGLCSNLPDFIRDVNPTFNTIALQIYHQHLASCRARRQQRPRTNLNCLADGARGHWEEMKNVLYSWQRINSMI